MLVERSEKGIITITLSEKVDSFGLQQLLDYAKYLEASAKSKAKQTDADKLAKEVNKSWFKKNKHLLGKWKLLLMPTLYSALF